MERGFLSKKKGKVIPHRRTKDRKGAETNNEQLYSVKTRLWKCSVILLNTDKTLASKTVWSSLTADEMVSAVAMEGNVLTNHLHNPCHQVTESVIINFIFIPSHHHHNHHHHHHHYFLSPVTIIIIIITFCPQSPSSSSSLLFVPSHHHHHHYFLSPVTIIIIITFCPQSPSLQFVPSHHHHHPYFLSPVTTIITICP